jgi:prepilin-type N-terminal cleavage/methylation domain-containing protein
MCVEFNRLRSLTRAFTLIELLIVVAIIAILAAIAVPNFLEAQTRSKISRVLADARSVATALEAYAADHGAYPPVLPDGAYNHLYIQYIFQLTTPVAYMTSAMFKDPFLVDQTTAPPAVGETAPDWKQTLYYFPYDGFWSVGCYTSYMGMPFIRKGFSVFSNGPSRVWSGFEHYPFVLHVAPYKELLVACDSLYDPSNGTVSKGGIGRFGGELEVPQMP